MTNPDQTIRDLQQLNYVISLPSNPDNLTQFWFLVGDEDGKNWRLDLGHELVPQHKYKQRLSQLIYEYTHVETKGFSFNLPEYEIGVESLSEDDYLATKQFLSPLMNKDTYLQVMQNVLTEAKEFNKTDDELQKIGEEIVEICEMSDPDYSKMMEKVIYRVINSAYPIYKEEKAKELSAPKLAHLNGQDIAKSDKALPEKALDIMVREAECITAREQSAFDIVLETIWNEKLLKNILPGNK